METDFVRKSSRRHLVIEAVILITFMLTSLGSTWPLVTVIPNAVPVADEGCLTVPLFNVWTVWWNADRFASGYQRYWDAPIFAPTDSTFVFSEAQPTTAVVAFMAQNPGFAVLGYNLYLLLSLVLNGWLGYLFVNRFVEHRWVAVLAGHAFCVLPFVHWQLGVLQLVAVGPIMLYLRSLFCFTESLQWRYALIAGVSLGWLYLSCNYYGLFAIVLTAVFFPAIAAFQVREVRLWVRGVAIFGIFGVIVSPVLFKQVEILHADAAFTRNVLSVFRLSAVPRDYTTVARIDASGELETQVSGFPLSPGWGLWMSSLVGLLTVFRPGVTRRNVLGLAILGVTAFALSMGPRWHVFGHIPFNYLVDFFPGFSAIRSPYRFAVFVQIAVVALAGLGLDMIVITSGQWSFIRRSCVGLALGLVVLVTAWEIWPRNCVIRSVPSSAVADGWQGWIRHHTDRDDIILHLPLPSGRNVEDFEETARTMFWSMWHRRAMASGYSGFFPQSFKKLCRAFRRVETAADNDVARLMRELRIRWLIVDDSSGWLTLLQNQSELHQTFQDRLRGKVIFRVVRNE